MLLKIAGGIATDSDLDIRLQIRLVRGVMITAVIGADGDMGVQHALPLRRQRGAGLVSVFIYNGFPWHGLPAGINDHQRQVGAEFAAVAVTARIGLPGHLVLVVPVLRVMATQDRNQHRHCQNQRRRPDPRHTVFHPLPSFPLQPLQLLTSSFCITMLQYSMLPIS